MSDPKEIWRPSAAPDYLVSSLGRLMRLPCLGTMPHGGARWYGGEPRYGANCESDLRPKLFHRGRTYKVSRLVCEAFHGEAPFPGAVVMHLDDDEANNRADNVAWGSQKENLNAAGFIAYCHSRTGNKNPRIKGDRRKAGLCEDCGIFHADSPSRVCPGCEAYREHQR